MAHPSRELEIRALVDRRQPVSFVLANWLLAELDSARLRLAAAEVELDDLRTRDPVAQPDIAVPARSAIGSQLPEWLTVPQFAQELGIGRSLVYDLVRRGELREVRRFGRLVRIHRDSLRAVSNQTA